MTQIINNRTDVDFSRYKGGRFYEVDHFFINKNYWSFEKYLEALEQDEYFEKVVYKKQQGMTWPYWDILVNFTYIK